MARLFGIGGVQMKAIAWDPDATMNKMDLAVRRIRENFPWVDMIVFHELCAPGLVQFDALPSPQQLEAIRQPIPGPMSDRLCEIARREKRWLVPGSLYERDGEHIYNTAIVISPDGDIVAKYRKMFPWRPFETETAGREFCVFDIEGVGRFGLAICYDHWYPEMIRTLAWMGAEVILHPTMAITSDRPLELILSQANAITNQCYFVDVNGVGPWGGGESIIVGPDGRILQKVGNQETFMFEMLDLDKVTEQREMGTMMMCQTMKQMRDTNIQFPQYQTDFGNGEVFKGLGKLDFPENLRKG